MVPLSFAGEIFQALAPGALFWPRRRALIVADLHFEKASWFAGLGQFLPPYDSLATLADLEALAVVTDARELWCLGDSFHDDAGARRLSGEAAALLARMTAGLDWYWISGNHDAGQDMALGGTLLVGAVIDGLVLRHEADPSDPRPELSGHFHPKYSVTVRGRRVARRCFVAGANKLILPAFGALTGGLDARHAAISRLAGPGAEALVPLADRLLRFAIAERPSRRNFDKLNGSSG